MARKILLADDSVTAQNMGRKILADAGYEVITVNNGSAALKKIAEHKPDLIVLDVYMPGYSGLEVCQRLKEAQETSRVPVLLTVGKLEPFKPEEAKRVRADGFIVKPFEASELLSALSKLEDKIVPRAEPSKPGRLARATAAIEEGRYDKTVAIEEDLGWKDRISFPSRKKEKSASEDAESAGDRSGSGRKSLEKARVSKAEEGRVDLGALAPEGFPKDVTPEEIAALAAAAAQVKGKIVEGAYTATTPVESWSENKESTEPVAAPPREAAPTTLASQAFPGGSPNQSTEKKEENIDAREGASRYAIEEASMAAASPSDVIAAIAGLNPNSPDPTGTTFQNSLSSQADTGTTENEPVTMAAAPGAGSVPGTPRWAAVSVAVGPDDAAISLEHEMQKAYAAFAAAENGHGASATAGPDPGLNSTEFAAKSSSPTEAALPDPVVSIPAMPAPEVAQALSALANASTEAVRAAAQELEKVAESYVQATAVEAKAVSAGVAPESVAQLETAAQNLAASAERAESGPPESVAETTSEPRTEAANLDTGKKDEAGSWHEPPKDPAWKNQSQADENRKNEEGKNGESFIAALPASPEAGRETTDEKREAAAAASFSEIPPERLLSSHSASQPEVAGEPVADGRGEIAKKESEEAASTAAAWATWRQIREFDAPRPATEESSETQPASSPKDAAAMAVAAGAEKTPEEASAQSESADIANIVDSVLADLRPKIFEEISRKMGKKK